MKKLVIFLTCSASFWAFLAHSAPTYLTSQHVIGFNYVGNSGYGTDLVPSAFDITHDGSTASSSHSGSKVIDGVDNSSNPASMTLSYNSAAEVSSSTVKTRASAILTDGFYNPAENNPFFIGANFTDYSGVPEFFWVFSEAGYANTFILDGSSSLDQVQFTFNLDGAFTGDKGFLWFYQTTPSFANLFDGNRFSLGSAVDEVIISNPVDVIRGIAELSFSLVADISLYFYDGFFDDPGTELIGGGVNFFNTLTFGKISGFDALGNPVDLISAVDSTGFQFETVRVQDPNPNAIPEASTLALFALGGLFAFFRRRRFS